MSDAPDPFGNLEAWKKCASTLRDMFKFTEQIQQTKDLPMTLRMTANAATIELMKMNFIIQEELLKRQARITGASQVMLDTNKDKIA